MILWRWVNCFGNIYNLKNPTYFVRNWCESTRVWDRPSHVWKLSFNKSSPAPRTHISSCWQIRIKQCNSVIWFIVTNTFLENEQQDFTYFIQFNFRFCLGINFTFNLFWPPSFALNYANTRAPFFHIKRRDDPCVHNKVTWIFPFILKIFLKSLL